MIENVKKFKWSHIKLFPKDLSDCFRFVHWNPFGLWK